MCNSTCFGFLPAHHQEHTTAVGAPGFTAGEKRLERFGRVPAGYPPDHDQERSNRFSPTVKPGALVQLNAPDDGRGDA